MTSNHESSGEWPNLTWDIATTIATCTLIKISIWKFITDLTPQYTRDNTAEMDLFRRLLSRKAWPTPFYSSLVTISLNLTVHALFCFAFILANDLGLMLYKQLFGETSLRGYMPGMITRAALLAFVVANLAIALAPWRKLKFFIAAASISYALFLLPAHPLRALFYLCLMGTLSLLAIVLAEKMAQAVEARNKKVMESK